MVRWCMFALLVALIGCTTSIAQPEAGLQYVGVNLAGAEFGSNPVGEHGVDYIYPTTAEVDYFRSKGMNTIRLPFRWERLQPVPESPFNSDEWNRLHSFVTYATSQNMTVILDPHNYATYYGKLLGTTETPNALFADFWGRLADLYKDNPRVIFGLMNEPVSTSSETLTTEQWLGTANTAIAAIRATGATNLILVPGVAWTGAHSWFDSWYGTPNAEVMLGVNDPGANYAIEVHQYLDGDSSGTNATCVSETIGVERVTNFTNWLKQHNLRGFLGEFAGANSTTCATAVNGLLTHLEQNSDVWLGWTWWAAGPWWGDYMFSLEPNNGVDSPLMPMLTPFLQPVQFTNSLYLPGIKK